MVRKNEKLSFTIDMNKIALNQRKFDGSEIGRGIGIHKAKKGKGSYTRKEKHKKNYSREKTIVLFIFQEIMDLNTKKTAINLSSQILQSI